MRALLSSLCLLLCACAPTPPEPQHPEGRYVKLNGQGDAVTARDQAWRCVHDTRENLIWEVKAANEGPQHHYATYSWFDGLRGQPKQGSCAVDQPGMRWVQYQACDTQDLVTALRSETLCGQTQWRLPTQAEITQLLAREAPAGESRVPATLFPRLLPGPYWTADYRTDADIQVINLYDGDTRTLPAHAAAYAMLVAEPERP